MPFRLSSHGLAAVVLLLAAVALAGCAGTREATGELPAGYPNHSFADIRQAVAQGTDTVRAFRAQAQLSLDTPERSGTFSATVRGKRGAAGDSLYMSLSPGFGVEAARVLVTPDSFFVYDLVNNRLSYGALRDARRLLPAPLLTGKTFENVLGLLAPNPDLAWNVRPEGEPGSERYVLTASGGNRTVVVDPSRWRVMRYTERTPGGDLLEERRFSEFDRFGGLFLPRRAELRRPQENTTASLSYRRLTLNPSGLSFELGVPEGTRREPVSR